MRLQARVAQYKRNHKGTGADTSANKGVCMSTIQQAAVQFRLTTDETSTLTDEVFALVVRQYQVRYKHIPVEWIPELRMREARLRFTNLLVKDGYVREELKIWALTKLRDKCEDNRLVLVGNKAA